MTTLREQMSCELQLQRKSKHTAKAYLTAVKQLAEHYHRSPDQISRDEVRAFIHHLITEKKLASSSVNLKLAGIRFFYRRVLGDAEFDLHVDRKASGKVPEPFSRQEIERLLTAAATAKHRAMLMVAYGGGLRAAEVVNLKPDDIHCDRMVIHVRQGKGNKDRFTLLSKRLLRELRDYWRQFRPRVWMFEGRHGGAFCPGSRRAFLIKPNSPPASRVPAEFIASAIHSPPTCWRLALTCTRSSSCWGI